MARGVGNLAWFKSPLGIRYKEDSTFLAKTLERFIDFDKFPDHIRRALEGASSHKKKAGCPTYSDKLNVCWSAETTHFVGNDAIWEERRS